MPWLGKALLVALKSRRGRELMFAGALAAVELAQSDRARELYARARQAATDPRKRQAVAEAVQRASRRVRR
jgi:hypothetical protein